MAFVIEKEELKPGLILLGAATWIIACGIAA